MHGPEVHSTGRSNPETPAVDIPLPLPRTVVRQAGVRPFAILVTFEALLMVLHTWVVWSPPGSLPKELWRFFHLDREGNLPTWFSASQLFVLALVFFAIFLNERHDEAPGWNRRVWLLCAAGALFLSLDEATALHEMLGTMLASAVNDAEPGSWLDGLRDFPFYYWVLIYVPIAGPLAAAVLFYLWRKMGRERRAVLGSALSVFAGAVGVDFLEGRSGAPDHALFPLTVFGTQYPFGIFLLEEFLEMFGVSLMLCAFVQHLSNRIVANSRRCGI